MRLFLAHEAFSARRAISSNINFIIQVTSHWRLILTYFSFIFPSYLRKYIIHQRGPLFTGFLLRRCNALPQCVDRREDIDKYLKEATSGDYDNLLVVSMQYADVQ